MTAVRVALSLVVALVLAACSSGGDGAGASAASSSTVAPGVIHSTLIDLKLPLGTKISSHADGVEIWQTPGTLQQTIDEVKPQLPIGRDLDVLRWCGETGSANGPLVQWKWGGPGGSVVIQASATGELHIERSTSPATACG